MSKQPQFGSQCVVRSAFRRVGALALAVALRSASASAAEPAPPSGISTGETSDYRVRLGIAYGLAPLVALGAGVGLYALTGSEAASIAGGSALLVLPSTVHMYEGRWLQGVESLGGMVALTFGGAAVGGVFSQLLLPADSRGAVQCSRCQDDARRHNLYAGAALGGTLAYMGYAVFDVLHNAQPQRAHARDLALWLQPVGEGVTPGAALRGLQLQVAKRF